MNKLHTSCDIISIFQIHPRKVFAPFETLNKAPSRLGRKGADMWDHSIYLHFGLRSRIIVERSISVRTLFSQKEKKKRWRICNRGIDGVKISFRIWIYLVRWRAKNRTSVRARNARANGPSEAIKRFCIQAWKAFFYLGNRVLGEHIRLWESEFTSK